MNLELKFIILLFLYTIYIYMNIQLKYTIIKNQYGGINKYNKKNQYGGINNDDLYNKLINLNNLCSKTPCLPKSETKLFEETNSAITYGTILKDGINNIIDYYKTKCNNHSNLTFTDLGCGEGISLVIVSLFNNELFSKINGVELSPYRFHIANQKINYLSTDLKNKINITKGNLFDYNISDSNIIFISNY